eukprot:1414877-Alexandrium_andersonii.AAC.1
MAAWRSAVSAAARASSPPGTGRFRASIKASGRAGGAAAGSTYTPGWRGCDSARSADARKRPTH